MEEQKIWKNKKYRRKTFQITTRNIRISSDELHNRPVHKDHLFSSRRRCISCMNIIHNAGILHKQKYPNHFTIFQSVVYTVAERK